MARTKKKGVGVARILYITAILLRLYGPQVCVSRRRASAKTFLFWSIFLSSFRIIAAIEALNFIILLELNAELESEFKSTQHTEEMSEDWI